jgi:CRP-like cAMP-binding protein
MWHVSKFEERLERFPAFRRNVVRFVEERLNELEQRFREVSTEEVGPRLSSELSRLSERFGRAVNGYREINLSQKELAQLTGTTLYTVSRLLGEWENLGIVTVSKRAVQVRDAAALRQLATGEVPRSGGIRNHREVLTKRRGRVGSSGNPLLVETN